MAHTQTKRDFQSHNAAAAASHFTTMDHAERKSKSIQHFRDLALRLQQKLSSESQSDWMPFGRTDMAVSAAAVFPKRYRYL